MPLSDMRIRQAKATGRLFKLSDGGGLQLWIDQKGRRYWRLAYRFDGKQRTLSIGVYPQVGLADARNAREDAKRLLASGQDPSRAKQLAKAARTTANANTFDAIADELADKKRREGKSPKTLASFSWLLGLARPTLGSRPVTELAAPEILAALRLIERRGRHETARRTRAAIGEVCRYAMATARATSDPTIALKGALTKTTPKHRAAILDPSKFGFLLRSIDAYQGAPETRIALKLLALTATRPGELRCAEWSEFDLDASVWIIPGERMKMRREHRVPLAPQAIALLRELHVLTGSSNCLLPNVRDRRRPIGHSTLITALRAMGFRADEVTPHGFRATFSSFANESGLWSYDAIERQLAHQDANAIRRAYARSDFWPERVRMMEWWGDQFGELTRRGQVACLPVS